MEPTSLRSPQEINTCVSAWTEWGFRTTFRWRHPEPPAVFGFTTTLSSLWPGDSGPLFDGGWNPSKKRRVQINQSAPHCKPAPPSPPPPSSVFHFPLCKLEGSGAKHVRTLLTPIKPPAVFFTPLSASLEQNMPEPAPPSSDFFSLFCGLGPHPTGRPQTYSCERLWPCTPPSPA